MNDFSPIRGPIRRFKRMFGDVDLSKSEDRMHYAIHCKCGCLLYSGDEPYTGGKIGCPKCKGVTDPR